MAAYLNLRFLVSVALVAVGIVGVVVGLDYDMGTARRMGPGFFPVVLSGLLVALAAIEGITCLIKREDSPPLDLRPMVAMLASVLGFAVAIVMFGLIPAFFASTFIATLAERRYGLWPALALSFGMCVFAWIIFDQMLSMPIPLFRMAF